MKFPVPVDPFKSLLFFTWPILLFVFFLIKKIFFLLKLVERNTAALFFQSQTWSVFQKLKHILILKMSEALVETAQASSSSSASQPGLLGSQMSAKVGNAFPLSF